MAEVERRRFESLSYREVFEISDKEAALVNYQIKVALIRLSGGEFNPRAQLLLVMPSTLNIAREAIWDPQRTNLPLVDKDPKAYGNLKLDFHRGERAFMDNGDILSVVDIFTSEEPSVMLSYQSNSPLKVELVPDRSKGERPFLVIWQEDGQRRETVVLASDIRWANKVVGKFKNLQEGQLVSIEEVSFSKAFAVLYRRYLFGRRIAPLLIDYFGLDKLKAPKISMDSDLEISGKATIVEIRPT